MAPSPLPARPRGASPPRGGSSAASGSVHLPSALLGGPPRHRPFSTLPSLPPKPVGSGLPERPTASALPRGDRADDGDRSPPRRGDGELRRRGGAPRGGGDDDWRGPPGSRPPRRGGWEMDRDIDRRRGGGLPLRDRSPDRFDSRDRFDRPPFDGPPRGGRDDYRPPFRGGRSRSRSRSWSPPPRDRSRSRSRSPSRSPVMRRGGPNRAGRGGFDGPRFSGSSFRDRSPPPSSRRPRSPSPPYRARSISRSPPPTHRQFGAPPRERTIPPISPDVGRRRSGGHLPPPSRGRSPSRSPPPHYPRDDRPPPSHSRRHSRELSSRPRSRSRSPPPHKRFRQGSTPPLAASARRPPPPPPQEDFTPAPAPPSRGAGPLVHPSRMAQLQQPPSAPPSRPGSELEEGEVDMDAEGAQDRTIPPPRDGQLGESSPYGQPAFPGAGRGRGFFALQPQLPDPSIPTGPRGNRFGGPLPPPPAARGGRGGMRGGMGGRAGGHGAPPPPPPAPGGSPTLNPYDPSPSPVTPYISLASPAPPPPSTPAPPSIPTGPKGWRGKPTPSSSTLPLPPMPGNSVSPQPLQARPLPPQLSEEELAAQQARAEQASKDEQTRMAQLVKDREMAMLKAQLQRWLPKTPFGVVIKAPPGPLDELEAEIVRHRQHRLGTLLPSHYARALACRKVTAELGVALVEREVAKERLRMTEGGVAMSRGISSGL